MTLGGDGVVRGDCDTALHEAQTTQNARLYGQNRAHRGLGWERRVGDHDYESLETGAGGPETGPDRRADGEADGDGDGRSAVIEIGEIVRSYRYRRRLTLQRLAECIGVTRSYLSTIETGKRSQPPSQEVLERIESALGIGVGELQRRAMWAKAPKALRDEVRELERRHHAMRLMLERLTDGSDTADEGKQDPLNPSLEALLDTGDIILGSELSRSDRGARSSSSSQQKKGEKSARPELERAVSQHPGGSMRDGEPVVVGGFGRLSVQVPVINRVSAGYPKAFTDLGYPARVSDEYISVPGVHDADAFAARVCGESMLPEYREGDVVVFSPMIDAVHGSDCFVRFSDDAGTADGGGEDGAAGARAGETTFKRVYFEQGADGSEFIRLQPLNPAFAPKVVRRESVGGLFRAVSVVRSV